MTGTLRSHFNELIGLIGSFKGGTGLLWFISIAGALMLFWVIAKIFSGKAQFKSSWKQMVFAGLLATPMLIGPVLMTIVDWILAFGISAIDILVKRMS